VQHRRFGIICMKGAGIKQDERIYGSTLLDITPTILTLFGLPIGEDMDGRALVQACEEPSKIERIPSWEEEPGKCGMHPADMRVDAESAQAVRNQFAALGYIAPTDDRRRRLRARSGKRSTTWRGFTWTRDSRAWRCRCLKSFTRSSRSKPALPSTWRSATSACGRPKLPNAF
jgi:hypothetical protein